MSMNKKNNELKWYQGRGNIVTLAFFFLSLIISGLLLVALLVMWVVSNWSKKTKLMITLLVLIPLGAIFIPLFGGTVLFSGRPESAMDFMDFVARFGSWTILLSLALAFLLSLTRKQLGLEIKQIWTVTVIVVGIILLLIIAGLFSGVGSLYQLSN